MKKRTAIFAILVAFAATAWADAGTGETNPPTGAAERLLEREESVAAESSVSSPGEGTAPAAAGPRTWVVAAPSGPQSDTRYDAPDVPAAPPARLALSSSILFGDTPLAWRVLLEGRADREEPELGFRGASWRVFRRQSAEGWIGVETDDEGVSRATVAVERAF